jgi:hypothetical protein
LEFSKFEKFNKIQIKPNYFKIDDLIQNLKDIFSYQFNKKKINFSVENNLKNNFFIQNDLIRI